MVHVRGAIVLNTVRFIKECYGADAHAKVLKALPLRHAATFLHPVREASWESGEDLEAYAETARQLPAPEDPEFHWKAGYFAGRETRRAGFEPMLAYPEKLSMAIWLALFDAGRIEIVSQTPSEIVARLHDFPTSRAACQRMWGAWEGMFGARVAKTACVLDGSPYCEFHLSWLGRPR